MLIQTMEWIKEKLQNGQKEHDEYQWLKNLLEADAISEKKRKMREGERYYQCEQDVVYKDFRVKAVSETYHREDGTEDDGIVQFSNPNRSNHHCVNPFQHILVAQKAAYLVGREPNITVKGAMEEEELKQYEAMLLEVADERFNRVLHDWVIGASNKGIEYLHIYYDEDGRLCYCIVPAEQIIPIFENQNNEELQEVIRYYNITVLENGKEQERLVVERWSKENVTYYQQDRRGAFKKMEGDNNPFPHWLDVTLVDEKPTKVLEHGWGRVPFIPLRNNSREITDLELIKGLVDAYDLLSSEGTNNLLDLVELYWVIEGYGGEAANAIAKKLQVNKAVHINDPSGKVEAKQITLPVEGRLQWMKMLRKDIFHFGMGVDTDSEELGKAPSGVSLKFQYAMFHLKINGIVPEVKRAIKEFFRYVTEDRNRKLGTDFNWKKIEISLNLSSIQDDKETTEIIALSKGMVSEKTLLGRHPFVDDVNAEMEQILTERRLGLQKEEEKK